MREATFESLTWPDGIVQLMDDHHLVVLSDSANARRQFGDTLAGHLENIRETEIVSIDGAHATDLPSFCSQLERQLGILPQGPSSWWRDMSSVITLLRGAATSPKRRYFLWHEADVMLEQDVDLFGRLVNAFLGVAAEHEHITMDANVLVLQRVVFMGGAKLGAYAEDTDGQFNRWLDDSEDSPFWEVASVIDRPPVITFRIDG
jgi:hypothetical protein